MTIPALPPEGDTSWYDWATGMDTEARTIADKLDTTAAPELIRDTIAAALVAGSNVTITPNDGADTITVAASGGGATFAGARVYSSASQSFSGGWAHIAFGNETYDSDAFHDNSTNNSRFTIPSGKGGKYLVTAAISYESNASGSRFISVLKNGSSRSDINATNAISGFRTRVLTVATLVLAAGDYVQIDGYQNSGSSLEVGDTGASGGGGDVGETWASITHLGA